MNATTQTESMITLYEGQNIYLETWQGAYSGGYVTIGTLRGYCRERKLNYETELARSLERGEDIVWTHHESACLLGDRELAAKRNAERRAKREAATPVHPDQLVLIGGQVFKIRVSPLNLNRIYNSNPISFILQK